MSDTTLPRYVLDQIADEVWKTQFSGDRYEYQRRLVAAGYKVGIESLLPEVQRLREFVGTQILHSDFRSADEMRAEIARLRGEVAAYRDAATARDQNEDFLRARVTELEEIIRRAKVAAEDCGVILGVALHEEKITVRTTDIPRRKPSITDLP